ncbi:BLUF domain-containing protein [Stenotrophomonas sp. S39]|uniref:BLUF domain-containing protein n=1 Tax=Stenotrophomonas sp. S39 TaxID=2767451 RepID=UPI001909FCB7|nr:BLUF domain-containing protein [Stenotrophomonas sp. S39]MBK0054202.1 BLUF domain-containing protein [Stenotrophomonas sp. S39]
MSALPLHALAYQSTLPCALAADSIDELLIDAMARNQALSVTGILLFDGHRFFQYLEGPEEAIYQVFSRIEAATRHGNVVVQFDQAVSARYFRTWSMVCRSVDVSALHAIAAGKWKRHFPTVRDDRRAVPGLGPLVDFWELPHA